MADLRFDRVFASLVFAFAALPALLAAQETPFTPYRDGYATPSTFSGFMKLSALALAYGLPRRPMEPTRPLAARSCR